MPSYLFLLTNNFITAYIIFSSFPGKILFPSAEWTSFPLSYSLSAKIRFLFVEWKLWSPSIGVNESLYLINSSPFFGPILLAARQNRINSFHLDRIAKWSQQNSNPNQIKSISFAISVKIFSFPFTWFKIIYYYILYRFIYVVPRFLF